MLTSKNRDERAAAQKMGVFWPNQGNRGAHVNVSGAAVTAAAKHPQLAIKLLEFLVSKESQAWYAEVNGEYPVRADVTSSELLQGWGKFRMDTLNLSRLGELNPAALRLMDRAGWK
jgi:iron(III) transport system substrate-binding protein